MKTYKAILPLVFVITGCTQTGTVKLTGDSTRQEEGAAMSAITETLCFERYSGNSNQDTASIRMVLQDNIVTGRYANIPYQKDARIGTISGTRSGNVIRGTWRFQQEGITDSMSFEFKIEGDKLLQKQTRIDRSSGRELVSDTADFSLVYLRSDCEAINSRIR